MKKTLVILITMTLALNANAQNVYTVGYYNVNDGTIAALYKNGERFYTAHYTNQTSKATRVTCNSQGDVYWWIYFYDYPSNDFNHSEIRINNQVYDPLTEEQRETNRRKSKTRCRVEHIFGFMENTMNKLYIRTVELARARAVIRLINLT